LLDQQKDHLLQIELLNEQLSELNHLKDKPKEDLPVNLNESIITELKTELNEKKVLLIIIIILMYIAYIYIYIYIKEFSLSNILYYFL